MPPTPGASQRDHYYYHISSSAAVVCSRLLPTAFEAVPRAVLVGSRPSTVLVAGQGCVCFAVGVALPAYVACAFAECSYFFADIFIRYTCGLRQTRTRYIPVPGSSCHYDISRAVTGLSG